MAIKAYLSKIKTEALYIILGIILVIFIGMGYAFYGQRNIETYHIK
jgi:RsiW-degrading membrane proteinase PrsW (M82 family)